MRSSSAARISSERGNSSLSVSRLPWHEPGWREIVGVWIYDSAFEADLEPSGPVEYLRTRPWSALARVPTADGDLFFKADPPALAFEPPLVAKLARRRPDCIPEVVAISVEQRWLLTRDAGRQLRELLRGSDDPRIWDELLPLYAHLQIELSSSLDDFLGRGMPDERPERVRVAFDDLLSRWDLGGRFADLARVAEEYALRLGEIVPPSVIHEEFNDNNIHLGAAGPVIIDWAESAIGHPFAGLCVTMRGLADRWGYEPGGPELLRLRDLYLEPWTTFAPRAELVELFGVAYALGTVSRALAWDRILAPLDQVDRAEFEHTVPAWLDVFVATVEGTATLGT